MDTITLKKRSHWGGLFPKNRMALFAITTVILLLFSSRTGAQTHVPELMTNDTQTISQSSVTIQIGPYEQADDSHSLYSQGWPDVALDPDGNAYAVWEDTSNPLQRAIYFAFKPSGGDWGANELVTDESAYASDPHIAVDPSGGTYVIWRDDRNGNPDIFFTYRSPEGTWSANQQVNADPGGLEQLYPSIAADAEGNAYALWHDANLMFAYRPEGGSWGEAIQVNDVNGCASNGEIAVDPAGNATAVWLDIRNWINTSIYAASRPAGGSWGANEPVSTDTLYVGDDLVIVMDASGTAYTAWEDHRNYDPNWGWDIYMAERPLVGSWGSNQRINQEHLNYYQEYPSLSVDGEGKLYASWLDDRLGNSYDVYFSERSTAGDWSTAIPLHDHPGMLMQSRAVLSTNSAGDMVVVWGDPRDRNVDIVSKTRPAGGGWGRTLRVNDDTNRSAKDSPALSVDTAGNVTLVWADARGGTMSDMNIYSTYRTITSTAWGLDERLNYGTGTAMQSYQTHLTALGTDATGNMYALFATGADIYFGYHPVFTGNLTDVWQTPVKVNDDLLEGDGQYEPALAVDAAGNAYAAWRDDRGTSNDIYFAYRPVGGSWQTNEKASDETHENHEYEPDIATDGLGNAYAIWRDGKDSKADIYFAYRPAGGSWGASERVNDDLVRACNQEAPAIAVDNLGNAYAVWSDYRKDSGECQPTGTSNVYFAYRPAGGTWGANSQVNDLENSFEPDIALDSHGNVLAAWRIYKDVNFGISLDYLPAGGSWGIDQPLNGFSTPYALKDPVVVLGENGIGHLAWLQGVDTPTGDILYYAPITIMVLPTFELAVTLDGSGKGTVTSEPEGISCGSDCEQTYDEGIMVTLTAVADYGSTFSGWGGDCLGTGNCIVTMDQAHSVTASFVQYHAFLPFIVNTDNAP